MAGLARKLSTVMDAVTNDVLAPQRAGLESARILRGPWGYLTRDESAEAGCFAVIRTLDELAALLGPHAGPRAQAAPD